MHVAVSSSATYASIAPGTENARRMRASEASATAGVVTARSRMPASRNSCTCADNSEAGASDTTTGWRTPLRGAPNNGAMSATMPCVCTPAAASASSASARIDSYEPPVTTTWRCSLAVVHTTAAAVRRLSDRSLSRVSEADAGSRSNDWTRVSLGCRDHTAGASMATMRQAFGESSMPKRAVMCRRASVYRTDRRRPTDRYPGVMSVRKGWRGSNMQNSSMTLPERYSDEAHGPIQEDLRQRIAAAIQDRGSVLVWDTVAIFPFSG